MWFFVIRAGQYDGFYLTHTGMNNVGSAGNYVLIQWEISG